MTLWFFGDSWPDGCELAPNGRSDPTLAFPALVGQELGLPVRNLARTGSSQPYMLEILPDQALEAGDVAIFCCTAKTRRMYRDHNNQLIERQFQPDDVLVNDHEDARVSAQTCLLLYFLCRHMGVWPFFMNLFDTALHPHRLESLIPSDHWLIPPNESVLSQLFDPVFFHRYRNHHNGNFHEWLAGDSEPVRRYIRPCQAHPNQEGHARIAAHVVHQLLERHQSWQMLS